MREGHFNRSKLAEFMTYEQYTEVNQRITSKVNNPYPVQWNQKLASSKGHNLLCRIVMDTVRAFGWQAEKINTTGWMKPVEHRDVLGRLQVVEKRYRPTTGTPGSSDISAIVKGRSVKIECKTGTGRQSDDQRRYQQDIEQAGGCYILCRHLDDIWPLLAES